MSGELWRLDGVALAGLIRAGKVSAREAVAAHLARLYAVNPRINAVVRTLDEQALAEAGPPTGRGSPVRRSVRCTVCR
jgi:amidase